MEQDIIIHIVSWMRAYAERSKQKGFIIGVSGGVDSAVASTLAARTELPLIALSMPIRQAADELERARDHLAWLQQQFPNVHVRELALDPIFSAMEREFTEVDAKGDVELALVNTRSRLRLAALYYFATVHGYLVIGTGNKVEQYGVGFFAKYGDGGMDLAPLAGLLKSQVYDLARDLGISQRILAAPPTDGLWPDGRTDLDQIGATYPELEWAMDLRESEAELDGVKLTSRQRKVLRIYDERHADSRHKVAAPPTCPIPRGIRWPADDR